MKKTLIAALLLACACVGMTACGKSSGDEETTKKTAEVEQGSIIVGNDTGKTLIQTVSKNASYPNTTYMITSSNGESIVLDPTGMPEKSEIDLKPVAITSTHSHPDHTDSDYYKEYSDVKQLLFETGTIDTNDFHIENIASSHLGDEIDSESPTNVITIVDVDGLRIVHMGDCGQSSLTDEQLQKLGHVDVMITQFENSYSDMSFDSGMGVNLVEQVKPSIVIPTHYGAGNLEKLAEKYGEIKEYNTVLGLTKDDIDSSKTQLYRIINNQVENK